MKSVIIEEEIVLLLVWDFQNPDRQVLEHRRLPSRLFRFLTGVENVRLLVRLTRRTPIAKNPFKVFFIVYRLYLQREWCDSYWTNRISLTLCLEFDVNVVLEDRRTVFMMIFWPDLTAKEQLLICQGDSRFLLDFSHQVSNQWWTFLM